VIARRIGGYGSISGPRRWYERLPAEVRTLVDVAGFGPFCSGLIQMRAEPLLYGALVERWWDTTNSFHFSSTGEMTLTPYDFSMLTSLPVRVGGPIPFDPDMTQWIDAQLQLLGAIPDTTSHGMVRYNWFLEHFLGTEPATAGEVAQYARGFLIYLFGTTLFANRENTVGLYILGALVHLHRVAEYDWGGAGLATLYCYMSSVSRRQANSLGGYWRVWELWVYTLFTSLASVPVRPIELSVPRSRYYNSQFERRRLIDRTFPYFRRFFDTITAYKRFIRQTWGITDPDIPHPPPLDMRVVDKLHDGLKLDLLMIGKDGDRYHKAGDFTTFLHTRVMAPLTPGVARAMLEIAVVSTARVGNVPVGGARAVAPIPGLPVIPTEIIYMRPDGVIEQIPLEPIEERDRRLVFALGVEQIPRAYSDELLQTIDRLLIMVRRRQIALVTRGIE
ncbi:Protein MAINTENANCE OF MERISTEMS, partial [Camellia lanceoleosa]